MITSALQNDTTQQEILQAAIRLYRKFGPNKVTMDDVANASGRSRSSLYYYYKNRDEIFLAVIDTIVNDVAEGMRLAIADAGNLHDKIYAFCLSKIKKNEDWKSMIHAIMTSGDADERSGHMKMMSALHKKLIYQESIILNEVLSAAIQQKDMRLISPGEQDMLVFLISSGVRGLRREIYEQNDPHDIKAAMLLLTDMIVKWLNG